MMTEKQAWEWIAEQIIAGHYDYFICNQIRRLFFNGRITGELSNQMARQVEDAVQIHSPGHTAFNTNMSTDRSYRIDYCQARAEEL